jgi:tryptophanyl-tRNA synthetase
MAADILIYKAEAVPVGKDQQPHIEFAREVARKFNTAFGSTFPEPHAEINKGAYIPSLDGQGAMSKSSGKGTLNLSDDEATLRRKLARAVTDPARIRRTDPGEPTRCPVYTLHGCYTPQPELEQVATGCRSAAIGCLDCKRLLADEIVADLGPLAARRAELLAHPERVYEILTAGAETCRPLARRTLDEVRHKMGLS